MNEIIELSELKKIQVNILRAFADYCGENNLKYFLFGGTAIGAVRHKGYIPWDDDIDVAMPREDYEEFLSYFAHQDYKLITPYNTSDYCYPFAKLINPKTIIHERTSISTNFGIYIDVFPVDIIPQNRVREYYIVRKLYELMMSSKMAEDKERRWYKNIIFFIVKRLFKSIDLNDISKKIDLKAKSYKKVGKLVAGNLVWGYGRKEIMNEEIFSKTVEIEFEKDSFMIMEQYDNYLKNIYGDYMSFPPKEKQVLKHDFKAYWK